MKADIFKLLLDELDGNSLQTMKERNAKYAQNGDCLHNFRAGAAINRNSMAQTCWGYMSKHLVALQDKVERNDFSDREDFLEKCQDTINYVRFLWCIGNEGISESNRPFEPFEQYMNPPESEKPLDLYIAHVSSSEKLLQAALDTLIDHWKCKGYVSVAELNDAIGIGHGVDEEKRGWYSLEGAKVIPFDTDGFALLLPEPKELT